MIARARANLTARSRRSGEPGASTLFTAGLSGRGLGACNAPVRLSTP